MMEENDQNVIVSLREKVFKPRNSLLTDIFNTKQGAFVYNLVISVLILATLSTVGKELLQTESESFFIKSWILSFGNFDKALYIWMCMFASTLLVFKVFCFWAKYRSKFQEKCKCWDFFWTVLFICYFLLVLASVPFLLRKLQTSFVASLFAAIEKIRMLMKLYAFIRCNVSRATEPKVPPDTKVITPTLRQFLYYMFAPTFIYKDSYPRTQEIRYKFIAYRFLEVAICIYIFALLAGYYYFPIYYKFGLQPYTWRSAVLLILSSLLTGPVIAVMIFILVIHSWQNAFAEILRFADRQFYLDWWTTADYVIFYRHWNIIVHDFMFNYIYKDLNETVFPRTKSLSMLTVFIVSAFFHEYIIISTLGFFMPFLFILSWVGITCAIFKKYISQGNIFVIWSLMFGCAVVINLYCLEYFVIVNCPKKKMTIIDYLIPRILTCNSDRLIGTN